MASTDHLPTGWHISSPSQILSIPVTPTAARSAKSNLPYIFILDIDGTIVGNVKFQVTSFLLRKELEQVAASTSKCPKSSDCLMAYHEDHKLVRPHFIQFLRWMTAQHPNSRFFIYTASEGVWADQEIKWIEKLSGIKFMRPLFTRKDCIEDATHGYTKSVTKVMPRIWKALAKDFPGLTKDDKKYVEAARLMVVDNMPVFLDFPKQVVMCPTYDYIYVENVLEGVPEELLDHPEVRALEREQMCMPAAVHRIKDPMERQYAQHQWLGKATAAAVRSNARYQKDAFWRKLRKVFQKYSHDEVSKEMMDMIKETCLKK